MAVYTCVIDSILIHYLLYSSYMNRSRVWSLRRGWSGGDSVKWSGVI